MLFSSGFTFVVVYGSSDCRYLALCREWNSFEFGGKARLPAANRFGINSTNVSESQTSKQKHNKKAQLKVFKPKRIEIGTADFLQVQEPQLIFHLS